MPWFLKYSLIKLAGAIPSQPPPAVPSAINLPMINPVKLALHPADIDNQA